jgi:Tol biopolymer transport system component/DNA-binding winged helix-turn-helix (wHTH) protein
MWRSVSHPPGRWGNCVERPLVKPEIIRFGLFEVDLDARELRRDGVTLGLQEQPFRALVLLLKSAGHVVTREQLREQLWPADVFVDFERGISSTISRLRDVIGDSAANPIYIQTIGRHGYRWIAPVDQVGAADPPPTSSSPPVRISETPEQLEQAILGAAQPPRPRTLERRRRWPSIAGGLAAVALAGLIATIALRRPEPEPKLLGSTQITVDNRIKTRIVTDGVRLYFSEIRGGYRREWQADVGSETGYIGQVSVTGGETSYISTPFTNVAVLDISRDGSQLLIGEWTGTEDEARIWVMPLPSGTPRRVGTIMAHDGTFTLDSQHLVYANGPALSLAKLDGSDIRQLTSVPGWPFQPRFSPDGRHLRFSVADTNTQWTSIWEMNSDGTQVHPFFAKSQLVDQQCCGNWSADGKYFLFSRNTSHGWSDIWVYNEHMTKPVRLTTGPLGFFSPVPSADGKKLFVIGAHPRSELVRYDLKIHQFVFNLSGISADQVEYSRDGRWVTYVAFPEGTLWRSKSDGSEKLQLTSSPMIATLPTWSPDGKQIAFAAARPGMPWKLFVLSADGGDPEELLPNDHRDELDPTWSPTGGTLAFGRRPGEAGAFGEVKIMLLNMRTRHIDALPGSQGLVGPRWGPQGHYLSAMTTDSQKIALFDFKTGKWTTLVTGGFAYQNWSKDGEFIYFDSLFQKNKELLRMRIPGGKVEHLASLRGLGVGVGDAGAWNSVTPDGSPMLMRNTGTSEIYRLDVMLP